MLRKSPAFVVKNGRKMPFVKKSAATPTAKVRTKSDIRTHDQRRRDEVQTRRDDREDKLLKLLEKSVGQAVVVNLPETTVSFDTTKVRAMCNVPDCNFVHPDTSGEAAAVVMEQHFAISHPDAEDIIFKTADV